MGNCCNSFDKSGGGGSCGMFNGGNCGAGGERRGDWPESIVSAAGTGMMAEPEQPEVWPQR